MLCLYVFGCFSLVDGIIFYGWKYYYFLPRIGVVDVKLVVGEEENPNRIKLPIGTEIGNVRFDGVYKKVDNVQFNGAPVWKHSGDIEKWIFYCDNPPTIVKLCYSSQVIWHYNEYSTIMINGSISKDMYIVYGYNEIFP